MSSTPSSESLRLSTAPVVETVRISVENELLGRASGSLRPFLLHDAPHLPRALRGKSWDRLEALGETFFEVSLKPRLRPEGVVKIRRALADGRSVVLESRALDHVIRPLARHLSVQRFASRRLEYRDGIATGRVFSEVHPQTVDVPARPYAVLGELGSDLTRTRSVRAALAGKHLLLVGGSGFIGKVWLAKLLRDLPEIKRITLILRPKETGSAEARLRSMIDDCPVFDVLGSEREERFATCVEAVAGDVTRPRLGLDDATAERLLDSVDVVVSCAGLTEFNPDLRDALAVNVEGLLGLLDFIRESRHAALLHLSTCFVAGAREGRIPEILYPHETPNGTPFDPEEERRSLHRMIEQLAEKAAQKAGARVGENSGRRRPIRRAAIEAGLARARELGWPNIYTFTKALGEALIETYGHGLPVAVVRPSIVESSLEFPWRGWNEGINTSAPLSYLLGTPFRQLPVNERKALDVIPVDSVVRGMTLVAAALVRRDHPRVTQLATSATNPLDLRRAVELTALAHRKHYRQVPHFKNRLLERLEAIPVSRERYERFSVPVQLRLIRTFNRTWSKLFRGKRPLLRAEKALRRTQDLIDLYEPFLLDNEPRFEVTNAELLSAALPEEERDTFGWGLRDLDWYDYWVNVHIPALRRWSYPLIEGRLPTPLPRTEQHTEPTRPSARREVLVGEDAEWPRS